MYPTTKHTYHDFTSSPHFGRMSFQQYLRMVETSRKLLALIAESAAVKEVRVAEVIPLYAAKQ